MPLEPTTATPTNTVPLIAPVRSSLKACSTVRRPWVYPRPKKTPELVTASGDASMRFRAGAGADRLGMWGLRPGVDTINWPAPARRRRRRTGGPMSEKTPTRTCAPGGFLGDLLAHQT